MKSIVSLEGATRSLLTATASAGAQDSGFNLNPFRALTFLKTGKVLPAHQEGEPKTVLDVYKRGGNPLSPETHRVQQGGLLARLAYPQQIELVAKRQARIARLLPWRRRKIALRFELATRILEGKA